MTYTDFVLRIACAIVFGLLIGLERQLTGHTAGIRINVLVCFGSCIFVLFPMLIESPESTRTAAQIVSGVGFLCSAIIFRDGVSVRGLNTAATIWCTAAIGVLTSSGLFAVAATATVLLLAANLAFRRPAERVQPLERFDDSEHCYRVSCICSSDQEIRVRGVILNLLQNTGLHLAGLSSRRTERGTELTADLTCTGRRRDQAAEEMVSKISLQECVSSAGWTLQDRAYMD